MFFFFLPFPFLSSFPSFLCSIPRHLVIYKAWLQSVIHQTDIFTFSSDLTWENRFWTWNLLSSQRNPRARNRSRHKLGKVTEKGEGGCCCFSHLEKSRNRIPGSNSKNKSYTPLRSFFRCDTEIVREARRDPQTSIYTGSPRASGSCPPFPRRNLQNPRISSTRWVLT